MLTMCLLASRDPQEGMPALLLPPTEHRAPALVLLIGSRMCRYADIRDYFSSLSLDELAMTLRRQSQGFSRGSSSFRGVTYHPTGDSQGPDACQIA